MLPSLTKMLPSLTKLHSSLTNNKKQKRAAAFAVLLLAILFDSLYKAMHSIPLLALSQISILFQLKQRIPVACFRMFFLIKALEISFLDKLHTIHTLLNKAFVFFSCSIDCAIIGI